MRLKDGDDFGNRMKAYEAVEAARKLDSQLPIYARIDGRAFSTFTRGMQRPFDPAMTTAMIETAKHLLHATHARIGYTQSDEISLVWLADSPQSDVFFSGKVHKMVSVLASMAAAKFARRSRPGTATDFRTSMRGCSNCRRRRKQPIPSCGAPSTPARTRSAWRRTAGSRQGCCTARGRRPCWRCSRTPVSISKPIIRRLSASVRSSAGSGRNAC